MKVFLEKQNVTFSANLASSAMYSLSTLVSMGLDASHLWPNLMMVLYNLSTSLLVPDIFTS